MRNKILRLGIRLRITVLIGMRLRIGCRIGIKPRIRIRFLPANVYGCFFSGTRMVFYAAEALRRLERFLSKSCIDVLAKVDVRPYGNGCPMGIIKQQRTDEVLSVMRGLGKPLFQPLKSRYGTERSLRPPERVISLL